MGSQATAPNQIISLPKGGGAQHGLGEKFSPDLHTGTGNFTVPIAVPPGRNGFQPQLNLVYSTGNGNGLFGLGWSLSIPGVMRKTSKGIPRYQDYDQDLKKRDTFILSGAEDLVPISDPVLDPLNANRYRPRTEGLFAKIIHHHDAQTHTNYWEVCSKDGLISYYGTNPADQVTYHPDFLSQTTPPTISKPKVNAGDPDRVFVWRLTLTKDPFGNRIEYLYQERDRSTEQDERQGHRWDQPLLTQIRYADYEANNGTKFLVTVSFEYEDGRDDPFSDYRAGFEIRTTKRCKSILVETHADQDYKVRRYEFTYSNDALSKVSLPQAINVVGFDDGGTEARELPPLEFSYSEFKPQDQARRDFYPIQGPDLPATSLANTSVELVDLFGNGLPDVLEMNGSVRYWRNRGNGRFDLPRPMNEAPAGLTLASVGVQLIDANGDGRTDLLVTEGALSGYYPLQFGGRWDRRSFQKYAYAPSFGLKDPEVRLIDLTGDGVTDVIRSGSRLECFFNDPHEGWKPDNTRWVERQALEVFPNVNFSDPRVKFADMTGDGMQDILLVHDGNVEYWPNLGYGSWGKRLHMKKSPSFPYGYDPKRILLGDVDGDGLADLIYVDDRKVTLWINQNGNGWSEPLVIPGTPPVSDMDATRLVDLLGSGISGVLWTKDATSSRQDHYLFLDLTGGTKPYILHEMNNNMGAVTKVGYEPSTKFYLEDEKKLPTRWRTPLPFPVQVVARVEVIDELSKGKLTTEYRYHRGYWDGGEREFRGFGMVEQCDTESFDKYGEAGLHGVDALFTAVDRKFFSAPTLTKTWFHQGPVGEEFGDWEEQDCSDEYWPGDPQLLKHTSGVNVFLRTLPQRRIKRDALRTLRGSIMRSELYALDGSPLEDRPYTVTEYAYGLREEQIHNDPSRERIFFPHSTAQRTTQWERGDDPLTQLSFTAQYDAYGQPLSQSAFAMPRRRVKRLPRRGTTMVDDASVLATHTRTVYAEPRSGTDSYIRNRVARSSSFTFANKPQLTETQPDNVLSILQDQVEIANKLHGQFEAAFQHWQPVQGTTGNYEIFQIFAHVVSYYDGVAYEGEALGVLGRYGAPTRSESLVFTDEILNQAYNDSNAEHRPAYLGGTATLPSGAPANFGTDHGYLDKRNGIAGYVPGYYVSAHQQKFDFQDGLTKPRGLPVATRNALNHESRIDLYDEYCFLPLKVTDPKGLSIRAEYNLRVLQPRKVIDPNGNFSEVAFSPSGLVIATWVKGKNGEGDQDQAGSRMEYDFLAFKNTGKPIHVRAIKRVFHDTDPEDTGETIESYEYSDGFGRVIQTRTQGEEVRFGEARLGGGDGVLPAYQNAGNAGHGSTVVGAVNADPTRSNVVVSGWQVYDNKGKVVEKYEPFFSQGWEFEPEADSRHGVHAQMYYDPRGQVICTVNPDGSEQRVIYGVPNSPSDPFNIAPTPWEAYTYDPNDNAGRTHINDATAQTYQHHRNTPASIAIDAQGRTVRAVARHRESAATGIEEHITESSYDIQGNLLDITDALGRRAFGYFYDLAKHALRTESIDAGTKLVMLNAAGNAIEGHDAKGAIGLHSYDVLNRPTRLWARDATVDVVTLREKLIYVDDAGVHNSLANNLLGKLYQHYDEAGVVTAAEYDFKGNLLESSREVISDDFMLANVRAQTGPNWALRPSRVDWTAPPANILDAVEYRTRSAYDALNRIKWSEYPQAAFGERYRLRPDYNRAGALERVDLEGPLGAAGTGPLKSYVQRLAYNAKGQRTLIAYGNGLITRYAYDPKTIRLVRMRTEGYSQPSALTYQPERGVLQDLAYRYDLSGNILSIIDRTPGSGVRNNPRALAHPELQTLLAAGDALVREFTYDPLYRLVSASGRECSAISNPRLATDDARCGYNSGNQGTANQDNAPDMTSLYEERYEYDPAGNILRLIHRRDSAVTGWSRHFGMAGFKPKEWKEKVAGFFSGSTPDWGGGGNRLTNFGNDEEQAQTLTFDANGNMTRENSERHFEWDHSDRMKVFRNQTGTSEPTTYALYLYDAGGQRVKKLVVTGNRYRTTTYLGSAFEHHTEHDKLVGGVKTENCSLHVMDDKQRIAIQRVGDAFDDDGAKGHRIQFHLGDHLGSSEVVVSDHGTWINREEFFPYGETSFSSFGRKRYRFTGKERDEESGLNYHGARYYDANVARWTSCDPIGIAGGLNLLEYVQGNPTRLVDSSGLEGTDAGSSDSQFNTAEPPATHIIVVGTDYINSHKNPKNFPNAAVRYLTGETVENFQGRVKPGDNIVIIVPPAMKDVPGNPQGKLKAALETIKSRVYDFNVSTDAKGEEWVEFTSRPNVKLEIFSGKDLAGGVNKYRNIKTFAYFGHGATHPLYDVSSFPSPNDFAPSNFSPALHSSFFTCNAAEYAKSFAATAGGISVGVEGTSYYGASGNISAGYRDKNAGVRSQGMQYERTDAGTVSERPFNLVKNPFLRPLPILNVPLR